MPTRMRPPTLATLELARMPRVCRALPGQSPIADAESPNTVARRRKSPRSISPRQQLVDQCVLDNPRLFPPVLIEASPTFPAHASLP